jgi:phage terminase large subunit
LAVRGTLNSMKDSVHAEFLTVLEQFGIRSKCKVTKMPLEITFPNGSSIIYRGSDDEEKLKSVAGITDVWIEEATEVPKNIFEQLKLRLRTPNVKIRFFLSYNPISKENWVYDAFHVNPPKDFTLLKTTYKDNRFLPKEYINALMEMKERNPLYFEIYANGEFGNLGERIYENWRTEAFDIQAIIKENLNRHVRIALDWGFKADATAISECVIDLEQRKLWINDEVYKHGMLNSDIAKEIKDKMWHKNIIVADSSEQKSIAELRTHHGISKIIPAKKGRGSIMAGIQFLQQFEIIVHPRCVNVITELQNYSYKKDKLTGLVINEPIDSFNHALDGIRYITEEFQRVNRIRGISKSVLGL